MARRAKTWQVKINNVGRAVACAANETILHAAIVAGIDYPYACASGNCGSCISQLDEGKVTLLPRGDASLSPAQVKAGQTLACRAQPKADVAVTWLGRGRR
jgi:ferredoxin